MVCGTMENERENTGITFREINIEEGEKMMAGITFREMNIEKKTAWYAEQQTT